MSKKMEGQRRQRQRVFVGVAAVLNFIVICAAFILVSRSLDERKLKRPSQSQFRRQNSRVSPLNGTPLNCCDNRSLLHFRHDHCSDDHKTAYFGGHDNCNAIW